MISEPYDVLLIGCGKIMGDPLLAQPTNHIACICKQKNLRIVGCVDIDRNKALRVGRLLGCSVYYNIEKAIKNKTYDLVVIASPDYMHFGQIKTTLASQTPPKLIFVEKPVCLNHDQLTELSHLTSTSNVPLLVNHSRRLDHRYKKLREKIKSRFLGEIICANATYYNGWLHNGIHVLDTLFYLFSDQINWSQTRYAHSSDYVDDFSLDATGAFLQSKGKVNISAFQEKYFQLLEFDLLFSEGRVKLQNFGDECSLYRVFQNEIGEKVLKPEKADFFLGDLKTPLDNAYDAISIYLESGRSDLISEFSFETVRPAMLNLLQVKETIQNA